MKGRIAVLDQINGRSAAALIVDGLLVDLLIDPAEGTTPRPGAIYRAVAQRPVKGQNGMMLDLGEGQRGFLRQAKGIAAGAVMLVQIATQTEAGKAAPVTLKILFKGRYAILTPGAKGRNVARSIKDEAERDRLAEIANDAMQGASDELGLILRSAADGTDDAAIFDEISSLLETCTQVMADAGDPSPCLLVEALCAADLAWRDWSDPDPDQVFDAPNSFEDHGVWDQIEHLRTPLVSLTKQASMFVEPTRALVAIDVNTGGVFPLRQA